MSLLTTTTDGQQVFLTQPILTSGGSDPTAGIVFTQNPGPGGPKTVVLQDGGDHHGVPGTSGLQYIIEDPETGEGTLLDFASAGQQGKKLSLKHLLLKYYNDIVCMLWTLIGNQKRFVK